MVKWWTAARTYHSKYRQGGGAITYKKEQVMRKTKSNRVRTKQEWITVHEQITTPDHGHNTKQEWITARKQITTPDHGPNCLCLICPKCGAKEVDDCRKPLAECKWIIRCPGYALAIDREVVTCHQCGTSFYNESLFYTGGMGTFTPRFSVEPMEIEEEKRRRENINRGLNKGLTRRAGAVFGGFRRA